jgi:small GTP-binding protein
MPLQFKICLVGGFAVGKTSLVRQFVEGVFDDKYLATIGVTIKRHQMKVDDRDVKLILWDIAGAEEEFSVPDSYLTGAAGALLVTDGTRPDSFKQAIDLANRMRALDPSPEIVPIINKADRVSEWRIHDDYRDTLRKLTGNFQHTSAKTGQGVEHAFATLARRVVQ